MDQAKINYNLPFLLLCIYTVIASLKPEFIIPGLSSIGIIRQIPNLLVCILFILLFTHGKKVFHNKQTKFYIGFILVILIGTLFARNPGRAFMVAKFFVIGAMIYFVTISFADSIAKFSKLIDIFLFCNILVALLGIRGGGLVPTIPALSDQNDFALLMNMLIPFSLFFGMESESILKKMSYFGLTGLFMFGVVVSFSRGGFVGLLCVLLYCLSKMRNKVLIVFVSLIMFITGLFFVPQEYWDEMGTIKQGVEEHTAATRLYLWKNALIIFAHHPILGVGPLNSGVWVTTYDTSERGKLDWGRALHSIYFTLLAEVGLVGTFLFFGIIYFGEKDKNYIQNFYRTYLTDSKLSSYKPNQLSKVSQVRRCYFLCQALTGALIGFLSSGVFLSVLYYKWFWLIMTYTVTLYNVSRKTISEIVESDKLKN